MAAGLLTGAVVVFDLDGTIADTAPDLIRATNQALAKAGYPRAAETVIKPAVAYGARAMVAAALASHDVEADDAELSLLAESMVGFYEADIASASAFFPGFLHAVGELETLGARLAVCTNKREHLARYLLRELGIIDHFQALAGGDTYPFRKPDPRHVLAVVQAAGGVPSRAVMVGDTHADIDAARAAGVASVAVRFGYSEVPVETLGATAIISHFEELPALVCNVLSHGKGV
jgi:phosphoglycolate phosphatase